MRQPARSLPPLDAAALDRLALRYVERFATTEAKLTGYLVRKLRERGWAGERAADPAAVARRMVELRYVDDRAFGEARAGAMLRRGLGPRRIRQTLRFDGVGEADTEALAPTIDGEAREAAIAFARRRRLGPFAAAAADRPTREKHLAAMLRAGHAMALSRQILALPPGTEVDSETLEG